LTYSENKKYLASLTEFNIESPVWESQEEYHMKHHFLTYYINCVNEGATKSKETGEPIQPSRFSLNEWIRQNSPFLG